MISSPGLCASLACLWQTSARVPGNAHRFRDFSDTTYLDFLASAAAVFPILETASLRPVGQTVLDGVRATRRVVAANTNLGILLLLAPLARAAGVEPLREGLDAVLAALDVSDSRAVYAAIRLAQPAGLGRVSEQDVHAEPTLPLRQIMALAADRDLVARQYANGFREVFDDAVPALIRLLDRSATLEEAVIALHLHLMARYPDSLIARKRGLPEAEEAARRADLVLQAGWPSRGGPAALDDFDSWLRAEGRGRNPGTTSDLVTACLFVALNTGQLQLPLAPPWASHPV